MARSLPFMCLLSALCMQKTFIRAQEIFWYSLEDHTTRKNDYTQEKATFVDFKKITLRGSKNSTSNAKKSFFPALTRFAFWLVGYVLCIFLARYVYKKCLLEPRKTFGIIWSIIRRVQTITWQDKSIFVDFKK